MFENLNLNFETLNFQGNAWTRLGWIGELWSFEIGTLSCFLLAIQVAIFRPFRTSKLTDKSPMRAQL